MKLSIAIEAGFGWILLKTNEVTRLKSSFVFTTVASLFVVTFVPQLVPLITYRN